MLKNDPSVLIVVDDLGLHPAVSRAVKKLAEKHKIHAASLMANGPFLEEALSLKNTLMLGAHLNILRGKPVSDPRKIPSLLRKDGYFLGSYKALLLKYLTHQLNLNEVELECSAQLEFLISHGVKLTHIDSEKHCHAWPLLFPIMTKLAARYGIARVRYPYEYSQSMFPLKGQVRAALLRHWCKQVPAEQRDQFCFPAAWGLVNQGKTLSDRAFHAYKKRLPTSTHIELICHPGLPSDNDPPLNPLFGSTRVSTMWLPEYHRLLEGTFID